MQIWVTKLMHFWHLSPNKQVPRILLLVMCYLFNLKFRVYVAWYEIYTYFGLIVLLDYQKQGETLIELVDTAKQKCIGFSLKILVGKIKVKDWSQRLWGAFSLKRGRRCSCKWGHGCHYYYIAGGKTAVIK